MLDNDGGIGTNAKLVVTSSLAQKYYIASFSANSLGNPIGTYKLSVDEVNTAPIAQDDFSFANPGETIRINIGANDTDANDDLIITSALTAPTKGTVEYFDNTHFYDFVEYTPDFGASGTDSFTYQISDDRGGFDSATVTVTINPTEKTMGLSGQTVYRFLNTETGSHLFTTDENEANIILQTLPNFNLEGEVFKAADEINGDVSDVFRFFNTETSAFLYAI